VLAFSDGNRDPRLSRFLAPHTGPATWRRHRLRGLLRARLRDLAAPRRHARSIRGVGGVASSTAPRPGACQAAGQSYPRLSPQRRRNLLIKPSDENGAGACVPSVRGGLDGSAPPRSPKAHYISPDGSSRASLAHLGDGPIERCHRMPDSLVRHLIEAISLAHSCSPGLGLAREPASNWRPVNRRRPALVRNRCPDLVTPDLEGCHRGSFAGDLPQGAFHAARVSSTGNGIAKPPVCRGRVHPTGQPCLARTVKTGTSCNQ